MRTFHGFNLIPEGLETGEYKIGGTAEFDELEPIYIVAYTRNPKDDGLTSDTPTAMGVIANGIPNGMYFCVVTSDMIQGLLQTINSKGFGDAIMTVFSVPILALVGFKGLTAQDLRSGVLQWFVTDFKASPVQKTLTSTPNNLDGYQPKNQKLRTYPYMYVGFNPPNGSSKIYRYEDFVNGSPQFDIISEISPNPTVAIIPKNYRGQSGRNIPDMSIINGYPTIGWISQYYNTWLAQNSQIVSLNMEQEQFNYEVNAYKSGLNGFSNIIGQAFGDSSLQALGTGANLGFDMASLDKNHEFYINQQLAQIEKQQLLPNTGHMTSSNATLLGYNLIDQSIFTRYTIKEQFARRIDKYFDMYGYKTNLLKTPNLSSRPNWNYVKTIDINIIADIPQEDLLTIKAIFDNGITLWHNPNTFLDYSQNNR